MAFKKIGIMTTGGDCSGLNTIIQRISEYAIRHKWEVIGIKDGTDGLSANPPKIIKLDDNAFRFANSHLAGSILSNGNAFATNFEKSAKDGKLASFNKKLKKSLQDLQLNSLILIGGNGSLSLAYLYNEIYSGVSLVCIPKTIDMDVPLTDKTIGFDTAVQQITSYCDQLLLTARSHHRWFVVQTMGRDCGKLALNSGVAVGADAILIPEIKFDVDNLIKHIKQSRRDYGIIMVAEGISIRGHSGRPADMISRALTNAGIPNKPAYPEYLQRAGDTTANDRILATGFADTALKAIENNETNVMVVLQNGEFKTISLSDFFKAGKPVKDPNIVGVMTSNAYVEPDDVLLQIATDMGTYIGEKRK
ncbi:MAG: ATP-dependent 6-phosphofructokinase [Alphaproteobacteria bacterium]|nr:ATP-dependent 6-phosphofructokinase [Alphaproteobacteria bacterium]